MKILAFSDLHRDRAAAEAIVSASADADLVIGAGDFATMGLGYDDTLEPLRKLRAPLVVVAGNHDSLDALRTACADWTTIDILHGTAVKFGRLVIYGLGFEVSTVARGSWNSQMSEQDAERQLMSCPENALIVTHAPPFGVADLQRDGTHEGSHAIRHAIETKRPKLNLCGHIHHSWGSSGSIGMCRVHNLGPRAQWFEL